MPFSDTYQEARQRFTSTAKARALVVESLPNPEEGPEKTQLFTDVAWYGSRQAPNVVIINSATHGVEGFCGSGCQIATLEKDLKQFLPADTAVLFIHALNPYGFAWLRRVNEDNVDVNRNFVAHDKPYPDNALYAELHPIICLESWDPTARQQSDKLLMDFHKKYGIDALQAAVSHGQYTHSDGLMFGGNDEVWSNKTLRAILQEYAAKAEKVAFIDIHTGLGAYGHGEVITCYDGHDPAHHRAEAWFDHVTSPYSEVTQSVTPPITGHVLGAVQQTLPKTEVTAFALEFGTYSLVRTFQALRAEQWLHFNSHLHTPEETKIKAQFKEAFYPNKDDWKQMVLDRYDTVLLQTINGLRGQVQKQEVRQPEIALVS